MKMTVGGLIAECEKSEAPDVSVRMLTILEKFEGRTFKDSQIIIIDKVDGVFYEIIDGKETKQDIPV